MIALCDRFVAGVRERAGGARRCRGRSSQLGARAELAFAPEPPRTAARAPRATTTELEDVLHLFLLNRGILLTPFHNMALMCPATTEADVDRHTEVFSELLSALK